MSIVMENSLPSSISSSHSKFKESAMRLTHWALGICVVAVFLAAVPYSHAIPAFSRQYGTSCSTCHVDFPKLNDFGKAFKDAGFKFPKDDETFMKVPPVMLGAPAQKDMWPHTIWPGTIPGLPAIGLRFNTFFQVYGRNRNNFRPADSTLSLIHISEPTRL